MNVEIKEINKINLKEDEILIMKFQRPQNEIGAENLDRVINVIVKTLPDSWKGRVLFMAGEVELTKITKEKLNGKNS